MTPDEFIQGVLSSPKVSSASKARIEAIQFHPGYSEPGYEDPASGIIATGNWNDADERNPEYEFDKRQSPWRKADDCVSRVARVLEKRFGAELEWSDQWDACSDCRKLVRTSGDSYCWTQAWVKLDGETVCRECAQKCAEEVLETFEGDPRKALTVDLGIDPAGYGYVRLLKDLENGFHDHQAADPNVVAEGLRKLGVERFLFVIDGCGQFDLNFSCWVHEDEIEKVPRVECSKCGGSGVIEYFKDNSVECHACSGLGKLPTFETDAEVSPAELMKQGLKAAVEQSRSIRAGEGGIAYSSIGNGTAITTVLTHEQIRNCPSFIMVADHYWPDGVCKCVRKE